MKENPHVKDVNGGGDITKYQWWLCKWKKQTNKRPSTVDDIILNDGHTVLSVTHNNIEKTKWRRKRKHANNKKKFEERWRGSPKEFSNKNVHESMTYHFSCFLFSERFRLAVTSHSFFHRFILYHFQIRTEADFILRKYTECSIDISYHKHVTKSGKKSYHDGCWKIYDSSRKR